MKGMKLFICALSAAMLLSSCGGMTNTARVVLLVVQVVVHLVLLLVSSLARVRVLLLVLL